MAKMLILAVGEDADDPREIIESYTPESLQTQLGCKAVIHLFPRDDSISGDPDKWEGIEPLWLRRAVAEILDGLNPWSLLDDEEEEYEEFEEVRVFLVSDEAEESALLFDLIADEVRVWAFELKPESAEGFSKALETISYCDETSDLLENAIRHWSHLHDTGLMAGLPLANPDGEELIHAKQATLEDERTEAVNAALAVYRTAW
jgi:hypothetical protein